MDSVCAYVRVCVFVAVCRCVYIHFHVCFVAFVQPASLPNPSTDVPHCERLRVREVR